MKIAFPSLVLGLCAFLSAGCSVVPEMAGKTQNTLAGMANTLTFWDNGAEKPDKEKSTQKPEKKTSKQTVVGTVRFSYEGIALIYTPTNPNIAPGTMVTVLDKDGTPQDIEMRMSEERREPFLVADIIHGKPTAGQLVVTQSLPMGGQTASAADEYQVLP